MISFRHVPIILELSGPPLRKLRLVWDYLQTIENERNINTTASDTIGIITKYSDAKQNLLYICYVLNWLHSGRLANYSTILLLNCVPKILIFGNTKLCTSDAYYFGINKKCAI